MATPTQDMVLGSYYLTIEKDGAQGEGKIIRQFLMKRFWPTIIKYCRCTPRSGSRFPNYGLVHTTVGRVIFSEALPEELRHYYKQDDGWHLGMLMDKKQLGKLAAECYRRFGTAKTAIVLDSIKRLGFSFACRAGITIAIADIKIPEEKRKSWQQDRDSG